MPAVAAPLPWTLKNIPSDTRERLIRLAQDARLPIGEYVAQVLATHIGMLDGPPIVDAVAEAEPAPLALAAPSTTLSPLFDRIAAMDRLTDLAIKIDHLTDGKGTLRANLTRTLREMVKAASEG